MGKRTLVLRTEHLTELTDANLEAVVAGTVPFTLLCGPATTGTVLCTR